MIAFIALCILTLVAAIAQMLPLGDDEVRWYNVVGAIVAAACSALMVVAMRTDFPGALPYVVGICVAVCLMALPKLGWSALVFMPFFMIFAGITDPVYATWQQDDGTWEVHGKYTYWLTGKSHATGARPLTEQAVVRRGYPNGYPSEQQIAGLYDSDGRIFIPRVCVYEEGFVDYGMEWYGDELHGVNVVRLTRRDGTSVRRDFTGKDTSAEGYAVPTFDDDPPTAD